LGKALQTLWNDSQVIAAVKKRFASDPLLHQEIIRLENAVGNTQAQLNRQRARDLVKPDHSVVLVPVKPKLPSPVKPNQLARISPISLKAQVATDAPSTSSGSRSGLTNVDRLLFNLHSQVDTSDEESAVSVPSPVRRKKMPAAADSMITD
jgi:hypothetical protein